MNIDYFLFLFLFETELRTVYKLILTSNSYKIKTILTYKKPNEMKILKQNQYNNSYTTYSLQAQKNTIVVVRYIIRNVRNYDYYL